MNSTDICQVAIGYFGSNKQAEHAVCANLKMLLVYKTDLTMLLKLRLEDSQTWHPRARRCEDSIFNNLITRTCHKKGCPKIEK